MVSEQVEAVPLGLLAEGAGSTVNARISILMAIDERFTGPLGVTVTSIVENDACGLGIPVNALISTWNRICGYRRRILKIRSEPSQKRRHLHKNQPVVVRPLACQTGLCARIVPPAI